MKIVAIADTHNLHAQMILPPADVLIHAGDISGYGNKAEVLDFLAWFEAQPHPYKIFIAGNHDFLFEHTTNDILQKLIPPNTIYLNDSGTTIDGIKIWGSPITPYFHNWAFNRQRGKEIRQHWKLVPKNTQILITHGPIYGILDQTTHQVHIGCEDLLIAINKIKPRLHICGHIHEAYGVFNTSQTTFINASVLNEKYQLVNKPVEIVI